MADGKLHCQLTSWNRAVVSAGGQNLNVLPQHIARVATAPVRDRGCRAVRCARELCRAHQRRCDIVLRNGRRFVTTLVATAEVDAKEGRRRSACERSKCREAEEGLDNASHVARRVSESLRVESKKCSIQDPEHRSENTEAGEEKNWEGNHQGPEEKYRVWGRR